MATRKFLANLNLNQNELQNAVIQNLASAPSNPKEGQIYYNTGDDTYYGYKNGSWVALDAQGKTYTFSTGLTETSGTVTLDEATTSTLGGVIVGSNISVSSGTISVADASTSTKGVIEIATDTEASTGTDTTRAINAKQLATKVTANTAITGATKTKITYDAKGLVTAGADLEASDIPNLSLSKITDVTATPAEVNVLDGITASTAELNILDGVTVSASDINSVTSKIGLTDLSIDSGSTNYLGYDNTTGKFSAKVDTTVGTVSTNLVTSGAVQTAIENAMVGGMVYKGVWTATGQTDYSSITLPVKAGYMYLVNGSATIGGIEWNTDDYLVINADVAVGGTISDVKKIDNTEGSDIVRLNATQTLTNKTIDADDNTISDLTTSNFKSGTIVTSVGSTGADTSIPTEKAVRSAITSAISGMVTKIAVNNTSLTATGGQCTWTITNSLGTADVSISVYEVSSGEEVGTENIASSSTITIKINSASNIAADTYRAVIIG